MASRSNPRQLVLLVILLATLVVAVVVRMRPSLVKGIGGASTTEIRVGSYSVPELGWEGGGVRALPSPRPGGRNPFAFGPPPTPTPDPRPTPTPVPTLPPRPQPTPTPPGILVDGKRLPPPPNFNLTFVGWLGPDRLPVAVFRDGNSIMVVPRGEIIDGKFIVREVTALAVTIAYVGYPDSVTKTVALAR